jgi:hypothetical protein
MRMSRVLLAGVAIAGAVATTSAFTNSNTFDVNGTADNNVGYGELAVSGVIVSNVKYNTLALDATMLDTVVFTIDESAADMNSYMTLTGASAPVGGSPVTCTPSGASAPYLLTCDNVDVLVKDITKVGLTVVSK